MNAVWRRGLHAWFRWSRGLTLGVRAAAFDGAGRVCLVRHTYTAGWHLPGGGVEAGETAEAALARELSEEAALEITGPPALHGCFYNGRVSDRDHVLVYVVREFVDRGPRGRDLEIVAAAFHPLDALPEDVTPGTRARLEEIASGRPPSQTW